MVPQTVFDREKSTAGRGVNLMRILIIFSIITLFLQGTATGDDTQAEILDGIKENYCHLSGISIPYDREVITRSMTMLGNQAKGDLASGTIFFKPPGFLRLEQEKPRPETIIANNEALWWYIPDKKRAYQYSSKEFGRELRLLSDIFRGLVQVKNSFQVVFLGRNEQGKYEIELVPDPPWQEIDRIGLTVGEDNSIRVIKIYNQLGSITIFRLGPLTEKKGFDQGFFRFVAPDGVQVVREEENQ